MGIIYSYLAIVLFVALASLVLSIRLSNPRLEIPYTPERTKWAKGFLILGWFSMSLIVTFYLLIQP